MSRSASGSATSPRGPASPSAAPRMRSGRPSSSRRTCASACSRPRGARLRRSRTERAPARLGRAGAIGLIFSERLELPVHRPGRARVLRRARQRDAGHAPRPPAPAGLALSRRRGGNGARGGRRRLRHLLRGAQPPARRGRALARRAGRSPSTSRATRRRRSSGSTIVPRHAARPSISARSGTTASAFSHSSARSTTSASSRSISASSGSRATRTGSGRRWDESACARCAATRRSTLGAPR